MKNLIFNDNKIVIESLAREFNLSYEVIREAVEAPFK